MSDPRLAITLTEEVFVNVNPDLALYDLENYLFNDVSVRYRGGEREHITTFDFFCIIIWKANRAKSKIARKLLEHSKVDLEESVQLLLKDLRGALDDEARMRVLFCEWGFRLPMASAILTVFYPEDFTVYDFRACEQLGGDHEKAGNASTFERMWPGYLAFKAAVQAQGDEGLSLRDKDRVLWATSFRKQLDTDIREGFMRLAELTPAEWGTWLARAYAADHGVTNDALTTHERTLLMNYLGRHEDVRAAALTAWRQTLDGVSEDEAASWLANALSKPTTAAPHAPL